MDHTEPQRPRRLHHVVGMAARRVVVTVIGSVVLLAGIVMLVTPGPGLVGIAAGLAILGTEYDWAQRALLQVRRRSRAAYDKARARIRSRRDER